MLLNLHKKNWTEGLKLQDFEDHARENEEMVKGMLSLSEAYNKSVIEETTMTQDELKVRHVGKKDPKKHLEVCVEKSMGNNIVQCLGSMLDAVSF